MEQHNILINTLPQISEKTSQISSLQTMLWKDVATLKHLPPSQCWNEQLHSTSFFTK